MITCYISGIDRTTNPRKPILLDSDEGSFGIPELLNSPQRNMVNLLGAVSQKEISRVKIVKTGPTVVRADVPGSHRVPAPWYESKVAEAFS